MSLLTDASVAVNRVQTPAGKVGSLTVRLSPVATAAACGAETERVPFTKVKK